MLDDLRIANGLFLTLSLSFSYPPLEFNYAILLLFISPRSY